MGTFDPTGVNPQLVERVRRALTKPATSASGSSSRGFEAEPIHEFEALGAPVDFDGVGSALLRGANDFIADVVRVNGRECAKAGRR
jgi:nicotinate phosphoribosyltransferase